MRVDFSDITYSLCTSFPEDHPTASLEVLGVLDEAKATGGLVSCPKVVLVHGCNGGCLTSTATVDCVCVCVCVCMIEAVTIILSVY